jgi:hypothetical protein
MQFLDAPRFDLSSVAPGDAPGDDDPYEKRIALARELEGVELKNPNKEAGDPGHLYELKEAFRKQTDEMAARHPDRAKEIALPEFSTLGEIAGSSLETEDLTHSFIGKGLSIERAYDDRIKTIKQLTGKELPNPVSQAGDPGHYYELKQEFDRLAEELAEQNPEIRRQIQPLGSIERDAGRIRAKSERHAEEVWEKSEKDASAWIARIGGGFYSFLHDPIQMATGAAVGFKAAGAGVKGLLWMGLKQGAANAGQEAVMQPFVQQWRKEAGMDYGFGRAAADIGMAGAFGFGLDVGVRSGVRGLRQAIGRPYLGPDTSRSPRSDGDGPQPSGAQLPGLPEGRPPSGETPTPRTYRGADPIPPMEALEQAARNAPEGSVLRRAADGDENALRELAKELGADADPAIRRALDELELEKLFPTPLHVDDGAHLESLARAIREESGAPDLPAGDAIVAPIRRQVANLADEVDGIATRLEDKPVAFRSIDPATVTTDASTFQFKSGGDTAGVTDRLRGVTRWDPVSAGKAIVFERADGSMVIADGHQRLGLAKRVAASGQDAKLDAYVFRAADGWTPEDVRAYAALKNMRESSGTSLDMAQMMRDRPDLIDGSLPLTDAKLRDAAMLARLSPEAFDAVVAGRLPPSYAALIGESVADSARHRGLLDEMAAADLANTQQARLYLKQLMELPTTTETQMTLFGEESFTRTVLVERAQVLDSALRTLKQDKRIFGLLGREADKIEGALVQGRDLNRAQSIERFMEASAARLADAEMRIKGALIGAKSVEIDVANLRRMHEKAKKLRSGFDDRTEFRKTVDSLLFFGDPQDILNLRAERLEHRRDATMRTARQLQQDYDIAAAEADGILTDLENLKAERDIALGVRSSDAALPAPPGSRNILAREANQIKAERATQLADLIEKLATSRGTVATILNDAAASVARGLDPKLASRAFVHRIADVLEREGLPGLVKVEEAPKPELAPVRMDDPLGPEAKAQAEDINWALELDDEIKFALANRPPLPDEQRFRDGRELLLPYAERWGNPRFDPADRQRALDRIAEIGALDPKTAAWADLLAARNDMREISSQLLYFNRDTTPEQIDTLIDEVWHYGHEKRFPTERGEMRPSIFSATDLAPEVAEIADAMRPVLDRLFASKRSGLEHMMMVGRGEEPPKRRKAGPEPEKIGEARGGFYFKAGRELESVPEALFRQGGQAVIDHLSQAGVKKAEIKHFGLDALAGKKTVTREEFAKTIAERVFEFRRKTSWFNPEANRMDYETGGTRAFSGPRIPGRGIYFERLMAFPKKLKGGEEFAPGHFQSPHWEEELAGTWASWRGSVREVPGWGKMVVGEEGQSDFMQGASSGRRPRVKPEEFLKQKSETGSVRTTPETPIDDSYVRTMARDLLLQAAAKKADSIAISTSETTARVQNTAKAAHFYDQQLRPALERELRRITGDGTLTLEKVALPKPMGGKKEKPYTVWAAKLSKDAVKAINEEGQPMFALRGFYSPAIRAAESISMKKGTGEQFWKQITKTPGVRKDELEWMGLEEFLAGKPSVTRDEVLSFMRAHQVELDEKVLLSKSPNFEAADRLREELDAGPTPERRAEIYDEMDRLREEREDVVGTKFEGHKVPGGENYRELLIRLPELEGGKTSREGKAIEKRINELHDAPSADLTKEMADEFDALTARRREMERSGATYESKHFHDQEIVHLRVDDRTGPNGEKVLFINEVQSDLHQAGRKDGYGALSEAERARLSEEYAELRSNPWGEETQDRIAELRGILSEETPRVPNAPFKGDLWLELALKRALLYASENGYDAISWARSDQIAKAVGAEPEKLALQYDSKIGKFLDRYTKKWEGKVEEEKGIVSPEKLQDDVDVGDGYLSKQFYKPMLELLPRPFNSDHYARLAFNEDALGEIPRSFDVIGAIKEAGDPANVAKAQALLDAYQKHLTPRPEANPILRVTPQMRASVMEGQPLAVKGGQSPQATPPRNATLHNTTLSTRAADEMASIRAEIDNAIAKSLPPGWRAEVRQRLVFGDLSERIQKRNPGVPPSLAIEGTFDPYERIIYVSMAALDPVERAYEEAGHALKTFRLIPEADYAILAAKAKEIGAREKFRIDERYGDLGRARWKDDPVRQEAALEEEAIMQMVAARARGDDFGRQSNVILDKLIKFLRTIRDMLGIKGFRTFEDVFEDMTEGGFARQMDAQRGGAGARQPLGGEVMASNAGPGVMSTAFRRWFGDSKVVDEGGKPLVVYHGTGSDVEAFANEKRGSATNTEEAGHAFFFTDDAKTAGVYSEIAPQQAGANVMPVYLKLENPMIVDARNPGAFDSTKGMRASKIEEAIAAGHDGVIFRNSTDSPLSPAPQQTTYAVFSPEQIKSAIGNRGTFDPADQRIAFAIKDPESPTAADASFIARAQAASEIMFALGDEGKGKTAGAGGEAKPAPERAAEGQAASAPARATATPSLPGGRESKRIRNLINQAAAEGKLPREDADALIQRFDMLEQFHKDGGKAKQQIAKELTAEAEHRKRQKDIAELRRRAIVTMVTGFRDARGQSDPAKAMQALIENLGQHELPQGFTDVAGHQRAIYGMALADIDGMLHEFRKTLITGQTRNKAKLSDVVRELHGEKTGDDLAAGFAQASAKVMEDLRLRFNAAGGNIAKRKDWSMPQSHDKVALLKGGKEAWTEFTLPLLDLEWMKHPLTGDDMPPAEARKMLGDVWDNLVSDGWHEREAAMGHRGVSAIANTRADPRSLIFANADAWLKYSERFGSGDDALAILVSHIRGMTKDIAAMEVLGPNPKAMLEYLKQFVMQQASLRRAGMPAHFPTVTEVTGRAFRAGGGILARDPVEGYAKSMIARAENMWNIYSGASSAPVNATLAAASQTIKNVNVATKLGGATVSALSDPFWQVAARKFAGLPTTKIIRDVVKQIGSAGEREARRAGVIAETYLHLHNEGAREGAALSATKISAYVADRVLSLSMLNAVTRYGNHAMSMGIQAHLADMVGKAFSDLDPRLQRMFRRWGLEATAWDAIRLDADGRARDVDFLSPADIRSQLVDSGADPSVAERYLAMTLGEAQYATLTGSIRGQAMVYGSLRAGTAQRELWSMFMQFKSFAVNLAILQLERIAREFVSQGFWRGAQYATYALVAATVGGALIEQLQQLRNGKDPRDMTTPEFWGSAAYRSGGLSIWGDLLYASENRMGGGVASTIAGPTASSLNDILNLTYGSAKKAVLFTDNKERTNFGREATNFLKRYTPGASLWYVRTAWERVLMDNLQRMVDPEADASFRRKVQNARKDYKQEFWWKPGGGPVPQRGPRLEAAFPSQ